MLIILFFYLIISFIFILLLNRMVCFDFWLASRAVSFFFSFFFLPLGCFNQWLWYMFKFKVVFHIWSEMTKISKRLFNTFLYACRIGFVNISYLQHSEFRWFPGIKRQIPYVKIQPRKQIIYVHIFKCDIILSRLQNYFISVERAY